MVDYQRRRQRRAANLRTCLGIGTLVFDVDRELTLVVVGVSTRLVHVLNGTKVVQVKTEIVRSRLDKHKWVRR